MKECDIQFLTIYNIWKQKDELLKFYSATKSTKTITEHRVLQKSKLEQLYVMLYEWFMIKRSEGAPISRPILIQELYAKMELTKSVPFLMVG